MKDDPLDRLLAPPAQGDPLDILLKRQAEARAAASLAVVAQDPEIAAKANRHARELGLPAATVERNLKAIERQVSIRDAVRHVRSSTYLTQWYADPRNAAAGLDDAATLKQLADRLADDRITAAVRGTADRSVEAAGQADGFFGRAGALLRSGAAGFSEGLDRVGAALNQWSADNPLPWTSAEAIARDRATAEQFRRRAGAEGQAAAAPIRGQTTFADVKAKPTPGRVLAFSAEAGIQSLPGMAAAALSLPTYAISQAGNIGQSRAENNARTDATAGDVLKAAPAAVVSALLERFGITGILGSTGKNVATRIGKAAGREAATEALQSDIEYMGGTLGTDRGFDPGEAIDQMAAGALAGGFTGGTLRGLGEAGGGVRQQVRAFREREAAGAEGELMDAIMGAAEGTKLKNRDPEALRAFIAGLTDESIVENVYLPGEAVASYLQSGGDYDREFWDGYEDAIAEAMATGGDLVLPTAEVAARLAGTPAWDALREDARFSPGGQSRREAGAMGEGDVAELERSVEEAIGAAQRGAAPRDRIFNDMVGKLTNAGFTPDIARQYASLVTARTATRAARLGQDLSGDETQSLEINRILPEGLRPITAVDNLDLVIQALRRGGDATVSTGGPSLLEWIAARGGIDDSGGDIASMGGDRWHRGKPGRRKLLRPRKAKGQGTMLVEPDAGGERFGIDDTLQAAIEAGFFPELARVEVNGEALTDADKADVQVLLDAISEELRGSPRRAQDAETDRLRAMADELTQLLDEAGIDATSASDADIRTFVQRFQAPAEGPGYNSGERGRITFGKDRLTIDLFAKADLSTFIHETGHDWLEQLKADAQTAVEGDGK